MLGGVAHLVERYIRIVEVVSSSLIVSTNRVPRYADAYRGFFFYKALFLALKLHLLPSSTKKRLNHTGLSRFSYAY